MLHCSDDLLTNPGSAIIRAAFSISILLLFFSFPMVPQTAAGEAKRPAQKVPAGKIPRWLCQWILHRSALQCTVFLLVIIN